LKSPVMFTTRSHRFQMKDRRLSHGAEGIFGTFFDGNKWLQKPIVHLTIYPICPPRPSIDLRYLAMI